LFYILFYYKVCEYFYCYISLFLLISYTLNYNIHCNLFCTQKNVIHERERPIKRILKIIIGEIWNLSSSSAAEDVFYFSNQSGVRPTRTNVPWLPLLSKIMVTKRRAY